jgi:ATP-dependent DNA helicase RecQ
MTDTPTLARAEAVLHERFGHSGFLPGQREAIAALLEHRRALVVLPTGGGKSLVYQLGAQLFDGVTIVVSPLIALMKDQVDDLRRRGIAAARLDSSLTAEESREILSRVDAGERMLLYVSPERFKNERFLARLSRTRIGLFAVDEAHCVSAWGHNFRPDYLKIAGIADGLRVEATVALTATATPEVAADIRDRFGILPEAHVATSYHRPNLFLRTLPTAGPERDGVLVERIRSHPPGSTIVYVTLQRTAEEVAERLAAAGLPARAYHAGMKSEERDEVQQWWQEAADGIVVATIAFGMGIDKADVRGIWHYNLPKGMESYVQEIGRAGRDGLPATVEVLGSAEDVVTLENFAYGDTPSMGALRGLLHDLAGQEGNFDLNPYHTARDHDIRPLVLSTALTYLELEGRLRQLTPFYAAYRVRPEERMRDAVAEMPAEKAEFVRSAFRAAKQGRTWFTFDMERVPAALGEPRERLVALIDWLGTTGLAVVQPSDVRQRYEWLETIDPGAEAERLQARFLDQEQREVARVRRMADFLVTDRCQTAEVLEYFGEMLGAPCGHCGVCETGRGATMPPSPPRPPIESLVDRGDVERLAEGHPDALAEPRQQARFLCGLSSPAVGRELKRERLHGALDGYPFGEVLAWCEG